MNYFKSTNNKSYSSLIILFLCMFFISSCSTNKREKQLINKSTTLSFEDFTPTNVITKGNYSKDSPTTALSADKNYRVSLYSNTFPIPMQKIHSWTAKIENANGQPLENAKIYIHGGMPIHRHGFPVTPRVRKYLGNGKYLIEGVKFSMIGNWEMRLNIKEIFKRDRAVFNIKITP